MTDPNTSTTIATHRIDHEDYIELRFTEASRRAVDELIVHLLDIVSTPDGDDCIRIFVNNGDVRKAQPITYLLARLREQKQAFQVTFPVRIVANFNLMPVASLLELFVRSLYTGKIQFKAVPITDTSSAVDWLMAE